jgi:uncharacterized OsmC-like protein
MRNGLNIAATSELVHEIQVVKEEALLRFGARVTSLGPPLMQSEIAPMQGGTIRVVRDFRFFTAPPAVADTAATSYHDQLLLALGGCVLVTFVQGCSARGITLVRASVDAEARLGLDAAGRPAIDGIVYRYDVDCDGAPDALIEIARYASCLSPNQRMFTERGTVRLAAADCEGLPPLVLDDVPAGAAEDGAVVRRQVRVDWRYGAQLAARLSGGRELLIDQPKQYLGLDSAPNPLEYFLAAAGAELAEQLRREGARRGFELPRLAVLTEGSVDMRGITNLDDSAPVGMHDITHTLTFNRAVGVDDALALIRAAAASSVAHALVCRPQTIEIAIASRAEVIATFRSDPSMLKEYLAELAARKQRAITV